MLLRCITVCLAAGIALTLARFSVQATPSSNLPPIVYTLAKTYDELAWMRGGERFPDGAAIMIENANGKRPLLPNFAASADPAVSFDGQRVLFSGKPKAEDRWQIWEIEIASGELKRLSTGDEDCVRPFYLPDERIVYSRKRDGRFVVEVSNPPTGKPLVLTYGPSNFLATDMLRDGRVLFEAAYPLGSNAKPDLYTVYPDGSGVESYRCDHGAMHREGRQLSSGDIVFASPSGLGRFTSARAQEIRIAAPKGEYAGDVAELPSGAWLLPWRPDAGVPFQLVTWEMNEAAIRALIREDGAGAIQPLVIGARAVPKRFPSGLHDWNNANLLCLNAYTSKYQFSERSIQQVRFYTRDSEGRPRLLGTAPVERDGSFFVQVPTERPLQVELLDASGKTLKREAGYFWMRRGEQRACVGCHAGPETSPENAVPQILLKSTTPSDMTGAQSAAGGH